MPGAWRERVLSANFPDWPDHVWLATSGTGGVLKLVGLSRAALESSARAVNGVLGATASDVWLDALPGFHVGGLGIAVRAAMSGARHESAGPWEAASFAQRAAEVGATLVSLVPAQVHDIVAAGVRAPLSLRAAVVGGGALDEALHASAEALGWPILPSYGLTEAASQVATARCGRVRAWLPLLPHIEARCGASDALALRGPSLLTGWMVFGPGGTAKLEDPKESGGWLFTRDRAEVRGREIRLLGRLDDLVKIRGELVDIAALERALQARVHSGAVRIDAASHRRNGACLRVVAEGEAVAAEARAALDVFPPYARPESVEIGPVARTALGKVVRG